MKTPRKKAYAAPRPTGHRYKDVAEMLAAHGEDVIQVSDEYSKLNAETRLIDSLREIRRQNNITQAEVARRMGVKQPAISKLEDKKDADLTLKEVGDYSEAVDATSHVMFGKSQSHAEKIKFHYVAMRQELNMLRDRLSKTDDKGIKQGLVGFETELALNLLELLKECETYGEEQPRRTKSVSLSHMANTAKPESFSEHLSE